MASSNPDPGSVPAALLAQIQAEAAEERRPANELIEEALERFLQRRRLQKLAAYGQAQSKRLGLTEDDVPGLIAESRDEQTRSH